MNNNIKSIGLIGISGVGKTTFITKVKSYCLLEHLSASEIIRKELFEITGREFTPKQLRGRDIDENQAALVSGFNKLKLHTRVPIVLDAHTVIDKGEVLEAIKPSVFAAFNFDLLVCLTASPEQIKRQRFDDKTRKRPKLSIENIKRHQNVSNRVAIEIGTSLGIPIFTLMAGDEEKLAKIIYPRYLPL